MVMGGGGGGGRGGGGIASSTEPVQTTTWWQWWDTDPDPSQRQSAATLKLKKALAVIWASEKFADYVLGRHYELKADHKPLVPLLGNKRLDSLPPRILRFRLRLDKFDFSIWHVPGKELYETDARAPHQEVDVATLELQKEVKMFIGEEVDRCLTEPEKIRKHQQDDPVCSQILQLCQAEWPSKKKLSIVLIPFWKEKHLFSTYDDILLYKSYCDPMKFSKNLFLGRYMRVIKE